MTHDPCPWVIDFFNDRIAAWKPITSHGTWGVEHNSWNNKPVQTFTLEEAMRWARFHRDRHSYSGAREDPCDEDDILFTFRIRNLDTEDIILADVL